MDVITSYIDGAWLAASGAPTLEIINPTTERKIADVQAAGVQEVEQAVKAARRAFVSFSEWPVSERKALLQNIAVSFQRRRSEIADALVAEIGCPISSSMGIQTQNPLDHLEEMIAVLESYAFERMMGSTMVRREPIGVCGLIGAWNWPVNLIVAKVAPALAAGCTVVVKPSEFNGPSIHLLAQVFHEAGVPKGVVNVVYGTGSVTGEALVTHSDVELISLTGSTKAGAAVSRAAAATIKRVVMELGGKSANIVLPDANLEACVKAGVERCFFNSGQSCHAPSRMLVHASQMERVEELVKRVVASIRVGNPALAETSMGPLANRPQFEKVQQMIQAALSEGAELLCGGPGRPEGIRKGFFVQPTVFTRVRPTMAIAQEEVFGPVLCLMPYETEDEAVEITNSTAYGLGGYVQSGDIERARRVAKRMRSGRVFVNGAANSLSVPMGGYKQSGNGRENGVFGFEEYLEVKAMLGYAGEM